MNTITVLFTLASQTYNLPPQLLDSVCYIESKHNITARHHDDGGSDSLGICQIKLATAADYGFRGTESELMLPSNNINYAAKYLAHQLTRYHDVQRAVVAYNFGSAKLLTHSAYSDKVIIQWLTNKGDTMAMQRKVDSGSGDLVQFNKIGDNVKGIYLGSQEFEGKYGPTLKHIFNTSKGTKVVMAKEVSQLSNLLKGEEGKQVVLTFDATKPSGKGNPQKLYTLDFDDEGAIPPEELPSFDDSEEDIEEDIADQQVAQLAASASKAKLQALLAKKTKKA